MDAIETPTELRRRAAKCDFLADQIPTPGDIATLRHMASEYRELADRMEAVIASGGVAENRATK